MNVRPGVRIAAMTVLVVALGVGGRGVGPGSARAEALPGSLAHWWPADGTPEDVIGTDDGTLRGSAGYGPGVGGDDQAFSFDGTNGEVRFNDRGGNFGRQEFTLAFFIKTSTSTKQAIWEKRLVCDATSFWSFRMNDLNDGRVEPEFMSDQLAHDYSSGFRSMTAVNDGAWHHLALARDGVTESLYIDGVLDATATTDHGVDLWNDMDLRAGMSICVGIDGTNPLDGELDELMIFTKALSQEQIQDVIDYLTKGTA